MRGNSKLNELRRLPLFAGCSTRELHEVASRADEIDVPADFLLTREGADGREFVVLASGAATVERGGRTIAELGDGDFLGELALVTYTKRTATVKTTRPSRLFVLDERDFRTLMDRLPSFSKRVFAAAAARAL